MVMLKAIRAGVCCTSGRRMRQHTLEIPLLAFDAKPAAVVTLTLVLTGDVSGIPARCPNARGHYLRGVGGLNPISASGMSACGGKADIADALPRPLFAGFQELLRPAVIEVLVDTFPPAQLGRRLVSR